MNSPSNPRTTIRLPRSKSKLIMLMKNARVIVSVIEAILNLKVIQKYADKNAVLPAKEGEVTIDDGRATVVLNEVARAEDVGATGETIIPFTIYNIANSVNPADSFRTFQIRDGYVTARPYFRLDKTGFGGLPVGLIGNYEFALPTLLDGQGYDEPGPNAQPAALASQVKLEKLSDVQIDAQGLGIQGASQIVFADFSPEDRLSTDYMASFWIEIADNDSNFTTYVWGRMWSGSGSGIVQSTPFPTGKNIIPLGMVRILDTTALYHQIMSGNLVNRYPPNVSIYRGRWSADSLSGQVFYPGDIVMDDSAADYRSKAISSPGSGTLKYSAQYIYIGAAPDFMFTNPHSDATNWRYHAPVI